MPRLRHLFCTLLPMPPQAENRDTTLGRFFAVCWALLVTNPLPPTPFAEPLMHKLLTHPCPSFPWCFCFLGVLLAAKFLGLFGCFLLIFQGF